RGGAHSRRASEGRAVVRRCPPAARRGARRRAAQRPTGRLLVSVPGAVPAYAREPPGNAAAVGGVLLAELPAERRLLVEHDEEVEAERQAGGIGQDRLAAEEETLADDHRDDGDVAGIAHVAEPAAHDQPLGRRGGRRGAVTPA